MRRRAWVGVTFAVGAATTPLPARASVCPVATPIIHVVDPSLQATDRIAPTLPAFHQPTIARGHGPKQDGCSTSAMTCDDLGTISFRAAATDDTTPFERIGYRLSLLTGTLPARLTLPADAIEPNATTTTLYIHWDDGATDNQEAIDFTLTVVAIDAAGNESAPQTLRVSDPPGFGCAIARPHPSRDRLACLTLAVLFLATRRRRTPRW